MKLICTSAAFIAFIAFIADLDLPLVHFMDFIAAVLKTQNELTLNRISLNKTFALTQAHVTRMLVCVCVNRTCACVRGRAFNETRKRNGGP